jgi:hypothetical protein
MSISKKSVQFPDDESIQSKVIEVPSREELTEEDIKNLWFTRTDYHFSRSTARVISKESERYGYSKHLDAAYGDTICAIVQGRLNMWALQGHSSRGLERWANSSHGQARKEDQYRYIMGMIRTQIEMRLKEGQVDDNRLREIGHLLSRKSRLFAEMMGNADMHAAQREFGMANDAGRSSPILFQTTGRKNLGLSGKVSRVQVSDLAAPQTPPPGRQSRILPDTSSSQGSAARLRKKQAKPGRVPRMA